MHFLAVLDADEVVREQFHGRNYQCEYVDAENRLHIWHVNYSSKKGIFMNNVHLFLLFQQPLTCQPSPSPTPL